MNMASKLSVDDAVNKALIYCDMDSKSEKSKTAAHEMGHIIAHIVTETYFDSVWIAGVCEWHDRLHDLNKLADCVQSYRHGKMTFNGDRLKHVAQDVDAEDMLIILRESLVKKSSLGLRSPAQSWTSLATTALVKSTKTAPLQGIFAKHKSGSRACRERVLPRE
jgi:hypothetical protein